MDNLDNNQELDNQSGTTALEELSHSDKMVGVFSEPSQMFQTTSFFPTQTKDWLIPILILFILIGAIRSLSMMNEDVYYEAKQKGIERIEKMVEDGTIPKDSEDAAIEGVNQQMEFMRGPIGWVINIVSTLIFGSIFFFVVAGIYFLFIKFALKGEGTYKHVLVANGLTAYITMIQVVVAGILTMFLGKIIQDTSLAAFMGSDRSTMAGFLLAKIDPVSIWAYAVLSIGFAKLFKSDSVGKYFILVFGIWLIGSLLFFFIAQAVPFLQGFAG